MRAPIILSAFFLLISNVICGPPEYDFVFYLTFTCQIPNRDSYGYNVQFFDRDVVLWNGDDAITSQHINHAPMGTLNFKVTGMLTGDEWLSDYFDVKMVLFHTCNEKSEEMRVDMSLLPLFDIPKDKSYNKYYQYSIELHLKDKKGDMTYTTKLNQN